MSDTVCLTIGFVSGFILSAILINATQGEILSKCRKQHNVYQCKVIAVPVEANHE